MTGTATLTPSATPGAFAARLSMLLQGLSPPMAIGDAGVRATLAAALGGALSTCDGSGRAAAGLVAVTITQATDVVSGQVYFPALGGRLRNLQVGAGGLRLNATALYSSAAAASAATSAATTNATFAGLASALALRPSSPLAAVFVSAVSSSSGGGGGGGSRSSSSNSSSTSSRPQPRGDGS